MSGEFTPSSNFDEHINALIIEQRVTRAARIKETAQQIAPRRTGRYKQSIRVVREGNTVEVISEDPQGHMVESGSINNPAYSPIRAAAMQHSKFEPFPKPSR